LLITLLLVMFALVALATTVIAQDGGFINGEPLGNADIVYVVEAGDNLDLIGAFYDVDVDCIISVNSLAGITIFAGDSLVISPACPPYDGFSAVVHPRQVDRQDAAGNWLIYVRNGDTLETIGQRYNASVESIALQNGLTRTSILNSGTALTIPAGSPPYGYFPGYVFSNPGAFAQAIGASMVQAAPPTSADAMAQAFLSSTNGQAIYIIQPRDTLDLIGAYYNVQVDCLAEFNGLTRASITQPGMVLIIPSDCPPYNGLSSVLPNYLGGLNLSPQFFIPGMAGGSVGGNAQAAPQQVAPTEAVPATFTPVPSPTLPLPTPTVEQVTPTLAVTRGATVTPTPGG
jgi:LysM repeat protein